MHRLVPLFALLAMACSISHPGECDHPVTCYRPWSGSSSCCLAGTETTTGCDCPEGYLPADSCGSIDPVCEGFDAGPPPGDGGGGCGGPVALCYAGWSGSPECCLEPGTPATCSGGGWSCPVGQFLASECGRIDSFCEGPADAGPGPGLYDDCTVTSECTLTASSCCGVCGQPTIGDVAAVNTRRTDAYYLDVACPSARDEPPICPGCAGQPNPALVATCDMRGFRPACAVVDLSTPEYASCTRDRDCVLAAPQCCACGEIDAFQTVAVRRDADLSAVLCDSDAACPPCVPIFDERASARCDAGLCVVDVAF